MLQTMEWELGLTFIQTPFLLRTSKPPSSAPTSKVIKFMSSCALALCGFDRSSMGG